MPILQTALTQWNRNLWNDLAQEDPFWAVCTDQRYRYGGWDPEAFFYYGQAQIDRLIKALSEHNRAITAVTCLDFGCGLGRLTRALAYYADDVVGVDFSSVMIERAQSLSPTLRFEVLGSTGLANYATNSMDWVVSIFVLQHMANVSEIEMSLTQFYRLLKPGGVMMVQLPSHLKWQHRLNLQRWLYSTLRLCGLSSSTLYQRFGMAPMMLQSVSPKRIQQLINRWGGGLVFEWREPLDNAGNQSAVYAISKPEIRQ